MTLRRVTCVALSMDDISEQRAAIAALSKSRQLFLEKCEEPDMLDTLEQFCIITTSEKEKAIFDSAYDEVATKFQEQVEQEPQFLTEFCRAIMENEDLKDFAKERLGKSQLENKHP